MLRKQTLLSTLDSADPCAGDILCPPVPDFKGADIRRICNAKPTVFPKRDRRGDPKAKGVCIDLTQPLAAQGMPKRGLEPPLPNGNQLLKLACVPHRGLALVLA
jgi:hypothetical protein